MTPRFEAIADEFTAARARIAETAAGAEPEKVLVLEVAGSVDLLVRAIQRVPGLEWLADWSTEAVAADEDFHFTDTDVLNERLYLVMSSQQGFETLIGLWKRHLRGEKLEHGLNRLRAVFRQLRDIRPWGPEDRLRETRVLDDWRERVALGQEVVPVEAELWFRVSAEERDRATGRFRAVVEAAGGRLMRTAIRTEIEYHGALAELPVAEVANVVRAARDANWLRSDDVMIFGPVGQSVSTLVDDAPRLAGGPVVGPVVEDPVVALFDGLPVENHELLAQRLQVDDPDALAATYPVAERRHGTAMASVVIHGDLGMALPPLPSRLYVRPVLRPAPAWVPRRREQLPSDVLVPDLMLSAANRLFGTDGEGGVAPTVRVLVHALADPLRPFDRTISAWARALDYIAHRYGVLIIASAGNYPQAIQLNVSSDAFARLGPDDVRNLVLETLCEELRLRRLLSPAEAINALTIGAAHSDASGAVAEPPLLDVMTPDLPSPISALGLGFRRSVKPELLAAGGRQVYQVPAPGQPAPTSLRISELTSVPPGVRAAAPGTQAGDLTRQSWIRGTSAAAGFTARVAADLLPEVERLVRDFHGGEDDRLYVTALLKTLLVHGSAWGNVADVIEPTLRTKAGERLREFFARFLGYGTLASDRVGVCTPTRATLVRTSTIDLTASHEYSVLLPPSLSGLAEWRRMTVTLGWTSPINPRHRNYRRAALYFDDVRGELGVSREDIDAYAGRRGTIQHEVFEGRKVSVFADGSAVRVRVTARADAGELEVPIPYAIAISLEVAEGIALPIYEEVQARLRPIVRVRPRG